MKTPITPSVFARATRPDDVDGILRDFYRAEIPSPWPRLLAPAPAARPIRPASASWLRRIARPLTLAAALAFLLIGYLTLAGMFPATQSGVTPLPSESRPIGHRPRMIEPVRVITPRGNEARGWEKEVDGVIDIYLERTISPAKRR
jgi:hypothetical protein